MARQVWAMLTKNEDYKDPALAVVTMCGRRLKSWPVQIMGWGTVQAKAPAYLLENSWPTDALLAQISMAKFCDFNPLNRQSVAMARNGAPIDRAVLSDWMGRTGALIAPVVDHMAILLLKGSTRLDVDATTAPVLDPGRGKTKTGYFYTSGRCCVMIVAGVDHRHPVSCSTIDPGGKANMPKKSSTASMVP
jgi:hypothetical protein